MGNLYDKTINWIMKKNLRRWLLFFPISVICSFLFSLIIEIIIAISFMRIDGIFANFFKNLIRYGIQAFFIGIILIFVSGYIAPNKAGRILLMAIIGFSLILQVVSCFTSNEIDYWNLLFAFSILTGSYLANKQLIDEEKRINK